MLLVELGLLQDLVHPPPVLSKLVPLLVPLLLLLLYVVLLELLHQDPLLALHLLHRTVTLIFTDQSDISEVYVLIQPSSNNLSSTVPLSQSSQSLLQ